MGRRLHGGAVRPDPHVFCLPAVVEEFATTGRWLLAATIAMGVALFFVYDVLLGRLMARWPAKV